MAFDGFRPDRYDITGAALCVVGVAVIMYAARSDRVKPSHTDYARRSGATQYTETCTWS